MSETGNEASINKPTFLERMAKIAKESRPESEGEKLRKSVQGGSTPTNSNTLVRSPIESGTSDSSTGNNANENNNVARIKYKKSRVAIKNELRILDMQEANANMNRRPSIIKKGNYIEVPEKKLIVGDPEPKVSTYIDRRPPSPLPPLEQPTVEANPTPDISIVKNDPVPDIAPLQDEMTPRIRAEQNRKAKNYQLTFLCP